MLESDLESALRVGVRRAGGVCYKLDARTHKGAPDRIVVLPGRPPVFVELKTASGELSPLQRVARDRIRRAGGVTVVLFGLDDVRRFVEGVT